MGLILGSIPRVPSLTVNGVRVARNAPSMAATADSSPERDTSVVDDDDEASRGRRREERRALPRRSAGLGVEPLNIVTSERVNSDRTTSATASRYSRPWPSLAPRERGEARLELPPASSRAEAGVAPPFHAPRGDLPPGPRAGGPVMSASTLRGRLGVITTRGGSRRGASPSQIEARGQGLEQSPLPTGIRIRGACPGVAIVNRRSASGGGNPIPPDTRKLDTREVSMPPPIGHRLDRTRPILALRGAACRARHQVDEDQLGSPRGGLAHRHSPGEA